MKTLVGILSFLLLTFSVFAEGDFGEGGGTKVIKGRLVIPTELVAYSDRTEYAYWLDSFSRRNSFDENRELDRGRLLKLNMLRSMYIGNPKTVASYVEDGETFIVVRKNLGITEFGKIELKGIVKFNLYNGRKIDANSVCEYEIKDTKEFGPHVFSDLISLRLCNNEVVYPKEIAKLRIEYRR